MCFPRIGCPSLVILYQRCHIKPLDVITNAIIVVLLSLLLPITLLLLLSLLSLSFIINYYVDMTGPIESIPGLILMITQYRHNEIFTRVTK